MVYFVYSLASTKQYGLIIMDGKDKESQEGTILPIY